MRPAGSIETADVPARREAPPSLRGADALRLLAIGLAAILAMIAIAADWDSPVRVALALALVLLVPGLALGELLEVRDPVQRLALATGASLAIATLVATAMFYAGVYSVQAVSAVLVGLTCAALVAAVLRRGRRRSLGRGPSPSRGGR